MVTVWWDSETNGLGDDADINLIVILKESGPLYFFDGPGMPISKDTALKALDELCAADVIVSFNGAAFDFKLLFKITEDDRAKKLAQNHIDIMFHFSVVHGYYASMQSFADAALSKGKSRDGQWAISAWETNPDEVKAYCAQDCNVLKQLYDYGTKHGALPRKTKSKRTQVWAISINKDHIFKTVRECAEAVQEQPPDQSWMETPPNLLENVSWCLA